ncbi:TRAP transporter TAXI family solute receptor [Ureibacillus xyleni]|uniref:TRAP transporter TAXI family solute receptor n=1 Tax=Ureibacillus xyleni TaxID=614648 RepID=A0A285RWH9_9BACL|nr:TAXI family TRAP transporter solute-binding subunit [Ureibacillus xyleni]SOB98833.1 TRAP transporter TAXI family solute receptor [Ureibacillus xyleni]
MKNIKGMMFVLMIFSLLLGACGTVSSDSSNAEPEKASGIIPIYTPGTGGIAYTISAGIGSIFNSNKVMEDVQLVTEATSGGAEIINMVLDKSTQGKTAIGFNSIVDVSKSYDGTYDKIPGEQKNLRAISYVTYTAAQVVTNEKSGIKSYEDLRGKTLGLPPGSATEGIVKALLKDGYGIDESEYKVVPLEYSEIAEGIKDGSIDAGPQLGAIPASLLTELSTSTDLTYLSIDNDAQKKFLDANPYYSVYEVPAGTYEGQDQPFIAPSMDVVAFTHEDADPDLVYNFLKTIVDYQEDIAAIHPVAKELNESTIAKGIDIMPLHEGAEKFYSEMGISIANAE